MTQEYPTPWSEVDGVVRDADGSIVLHGIDAGSPYDEGDVVARIVRAVNAHDALVAALRRALEAIETRRVQGWIGGTAAASFGFPSQSEADAIGQLKAALELAGPDVPGEQADVNKE